VFNLLLLHYNFTSLDSVEKWRWSIVGSVRKSIYQAAHAKGYYKSWEWNYYSMSLDVFCYISLMYTLI